MTDATREPEIVASNSEQWPHGHAVVRLVSGDTEVFRCTECGNESDDPWDVSHDPLAPDAIAKELEDYVEDRTDSLSDALLVRAISALRSR